MAGVQRLVDGVRGTGGDRTGDAHYVLRAQIGGTIHHTLDEAGTVTEVHEGQVLSVFTATGHPTTQMDPAAHIMEGQLAAIVGAHAACPVGSGGEDRCGIAGSHNAMSLADPAWPPGSIPPYPRCCDPPHLVAKLRPRRRILRPPHLVAKLAPGPPILRREHSVAEFSGIYRYISCNFNTWMFGFCNSPSTNMG